MQQIYFAKSYSYQNIKRKKGFSYSFKSEASKYDKLDKIVYFGLLYVNIMKISRSLLLLQLYFNQNIILQILQLDLFDITTGTQKAQLCFEYPCMENICIVLVFLKDI